MSATNPEGARFYTVSQVGRMIGVSDQSVRRWVKAGELKAYKPKKEYRIAETDLQDFLEGRQAGPLAQAPLPDFYLQRREPTPVERHAIDTLKDYCDRLEEFLSGAERTNVPHTLWLMEADTAINMAALSLPLAERESIRPMLVPVATRMVGLAHRVFDGARKAGAVVADDNNVINAVERFAIAS